MSDIVLKGILCVVLLLPGLLRAGDTSSLDSLQKEVDELRRSIATKNKDSARSIVDHKVSDRFGSNSPVQTRGPKLFIGGLLQVWYYSIQNDNRALFDSPAGLGTADTNEASDNDGFKIRRAEVNFAMGVHKNVTAYMMLDFAYDLNSIPIMSSNQNFKTANFVGNEFSTVNGVLGNTLPVTSAQTGGGAYTPSILQDALVNFHGIVPHHDFTIGQYMYTFSMDEFSHNGTLDFVERAVISNSFGREAGMTIHGTWWNHGGGCCYCGLYDTGRFQYWLSVFNGAGNYHQTSRLSLNRSDDNDEKDFLATFLVRPVWKDSTWGNLEFAWSACAGVHGEASGRDPVAAPVNGLNRNQNQAIRHDAWVYYRPGGPAKGLWLKGEAQWVKDRNAPLTVSDLAANDTLGIGFQTNGKPFPRTGWYTSLGYNFGQSAHENPKWLKPFEVALRFEEFETIYTADPANPAHTNAHLTKIFTSGINYYIRGHDAKIQLNYNIVDNPNGSASQPFHNTRNDSFVMNYQMTF
jgi:hypothetical protein